MAITCQKLLYMLPKHKMKIQFQSVRLCSHLTGIGTNKTGRKKVDYVKKAETYYDMQYGKLLGFPQWNKIKKVMKVDACPVIMVNNFANNEELIEEIKENGAISLNERYNYLKEMKGGDVKMAARKEDYLEEQIKVEENEVHEAEVKHTFDDSSRLISGSEGIHATAIQEGHIPSEKMRHLKEQYTETGVFEDSDKDIVEKQFVFAPVQKINSNVPLSWPGHLLLYNYGNLAYENAHFPEDINCQMSNLSVHHECDLCKLLPIIALDLRKFDHVLDIYPEMNYGFMILQTLIEVSVDLMFSKSYYRYTLAAELACKYLPKSELNLINEVKNNSNCREAYDKVIYVTEGLNDRFSLSENTNANIFASKHIRWRTQMPAYEANTLLMGIQSLKVGGSMVYGTKTLSPIHNEGVVMLALRRLQMETSIKVAVVNLEETARVLSFLFNFQRGLDLKYGHLVVPNSYRKSGPFYFCKFQRLE